MVPAISANFSIPKVDIPIKYLNPTQVHYLTVQSVLD